MKIKFEEIDTNIFKILQFNLGGENCYMVTPIAGSFAKWDKENLIFRSSIWNSKGEAVSLSYKKFFNYGESPSITNDPKNLSKVKIMEKIDGSTLIVSKYKGNLISRTRGTTDARTLNNGYEIELLKELYPKCFNFTEENLSYIYEWVTPDNKIIINYGESPDIYLTGVISHEDYNLLPQSKVDEIAKSFDVKRPKVYSFGNIEELISSVSELKGQEGVCVYFNNEQDIKKVKSAWYLSLHKFKSEISSYENIVDLYFTLNRPNYTDFYNYVCNTFDFELAEMSKSQISKICDGMKEVNDIVHYMKEKVKSIKHLSRKECASIILSDYGKTNRSGMVFSILDGKELESKDYKKLLFQVTKM